MPYIDGLTIAIQAGGQSNRMGQDKALLPFLGQPLIARVVARLEGLGCEMLIITNQPETYAFLGLPLIADIVSGQGVLGGLYTALFAAHQPLVAVVACDMPFVQSELLAEECQLLRREHVDVVIPRSPMGLEPLHAIYQRETCLPAAKAALEAGERRLVAWFPAVRVREMPPEEIALVDPDFRSFINVNQPMEFQQAEALALQTEQPPNQKSAQGAHKLKRRSAGRTQPK